MKNPIYSKKKYAIYFPSIPSISTRNIPIKTSDTLIIILINVSFTNAEKNVFAAIASFLFNGKVKNITGAYIAQHLADEMRFVNNSNNQRVMHSAHSPFNELFGNKFIRILHTCTIIL